MEGVCYQSSEMLYWKNYELLGLKDSIIHELLETLKYNNKRFE